MRLSGRLALVIGSESAIGEACAVRLAEEGADLTIATTSSIPLASPGELVGCPTLVADIETEGGARQLADDVGARWDHLDILVICTAAMDHDNTDRYTVSEWNRITRTNVYGPMLATRALAPLLAAAQSASVVYLGSIDGIAGNPSFPAYSTSRAGLIGLTHLMANDAAADGIRVNCVAAAAIVPTASTADMAKTTATVPPEVVAEVTPLGRVARPEDVAGAVAFLASDDAAYVTGVVLPVDGGRLAVTPGTGTFREKSRWTSV